MNRENCSPRRLVSCPASIGFWALWAATGCQAKAPAADEVSAAGGLSIALDQLSETPQFFDCESGGVAMQIVARSRLCPA